MADPEIANPHGIPSWALTKNGVQFLDYPERAGGRLPDFCIIGAAKCATTSINDYLAQHPAVFMNPLNEPNYFSTDAHLARGEQWYKGQYADACANQICGEASTSYTRYPVCQGTPARIARANPAMKLIYIVREPLARLKSDCLQKMKHAKHVQGNDLTDLSLDEMLDMAQDPASAVYTSPLTTSQYLDQLRQYEPYFPRPQIHVVIYEAFVSRPQEVLAGIFRFLGVDDAFKVDMSERRNMTQTFTHSLAKERVLKPLRRLPGFGSLRHLVPRDLRRNILEALVRRDNTPDPDFSPARLDQLKVHFLPHTEALENWLGFELKEWREQGANEANDRGDHVS